MNLRTTLPFLVIVAFTTLIKAADTDFDGLDDSIETNTGVYVDTNNTGTNPLVADSDDDGAGDWYEVTASFTNPNNVASKPNIPYPLPGPNGSPGVTNKPVKVYIMSGDSAMDSMGKVSGTGPGTLNTIVNQQYKFPNLVNGQGAWVTRNDVLVHSFQTNNGNIIKQPLSPTRSGDSFGPELGFGNVMAWYHDEPILIIRAANGNRALGWDLLPPGSQRIDWTDGSTYAGYGESPGSWITGTGPSPISWYAGKEFDDYFLNEADMGPADWVNATSYPAGCEVRHNGVVYKSNAAHTSSLDSEPGVGAGSATYWNVYSVSNTVDFLDHFATQYPQWASQGFEIAGYVWWQGWRDGNTAAHTANYEEHLMQLINQLRQYYANRYPGRARADTPFVVGTLGFYGQSESGNFLQIANAQLAVDGAAGNHPEFVGNVKTIDTRDYWRSAAQSPLNNYTIYNQNAETCMLAGDAFGRAMARMQGWTLSLSLSASVNGSVTGDGGYNPNATAILTANPRSGYVFTGWTGDASGSGNPLEILMDSDKTIGATFSPDTNDDDEDGLTNYQEIVEQGTNPALTDTDADGIPDFAEVNYAGSFFKLVPGSFTYPQAVTDAAARHGRVASFPNPVDYSRMAAKARQTTQGFLWIGLSDAATEGTWRWTEGTTVTYNRWLAGQPSGGVAENHLVIMENSTQWADANKNFVAAGYLFEHVGLDPLAPDTDADGMTDIQEINTTHSDPFLDDTDSDGLLDGAEVNSHGSSPLLTDTDDDGINDRTEVEVYLTNPALKDTDGDGFDDLFEINAGFNPTLNTSTPDALTSTLTAVELRSYAVNGVSYRIEVSTDLQEWNTIETDIIGQGAIITRFYSIESQPKRYFRVTSN